MTSICPNCQQSVRTGAKYCGYCGTSLPVVSSAEALQPPILPQGTVQKKAAKQSKASTTAPGKADRVVTSVAIILLFLIILLSILIRHWSDVSPWLSQLLP